ncbi:hypothetical protein JRO89_XS05G0112500 [Xanthoceras sorbifolium]|uniref:Reverse transcriptase zinc-binding domain-containing protein n=1 Tax=Xanthoceras sorbifolium TaxID=99658 RepID=A0ABQ8I1I3_9ROSI|nr:hypothetical protein JRO89_XS05G0112500 [Xanthoceras sorbifolium]
MLDIMVVGRIRLYGEELKMMLLHHKLLTNQQRSIRGLDDSASCSSCGAVIEDLNHLFRGCSAAKKIWESYCCNSTKSAGNHYNTPRGPAWDCNSGSDAAIKEIVINHEEAVDSVTFTTIDRATGQFLSTAIFGGLCGKPDKANLRDIEMDELMRQVQQLQEHLGRFGALGHDDSCHGSENGVSNDEEEVNHLYHANNRIPGEEASLPNQVVSQANNFDHNTLSNVRLQQLS